MALNILLLPATSCDSERCFSELGDMMEPCCMRMKPDIVCALQCVRSWNRIELKRSKFCWLYLFSTNVYRYPTRYLASLHTAKYPPLPQFYIIGRLLEVFGAATPCQDSVYTPVNLKLIQSIRFRPWGPSIRSIRSGGEQSINRFDLDPQNRLNRLLATVCVKRFECFPHSKSHIHSPYSSHADYLTILSPPPSLTQGFWIWSRRRTRALQ